MKICFLAGADSIHSYRWIKYFAQKGNEITWLSLSENKFGGLANYDVRTLRGFGVKYLSVIFNAPILKGLIKKAAPDILHAHYAGVYGILGALSGCHPFVITAWGSDILIAAKSNIFRPFIKMALSKADLVTCDADILKEELIKLGVADNKIEIIYFGVDTEEFIPGPKDEKIIVALGIEDSLSVISLRNFEPVYNVETLIKAVPIVAKEVPNANFIIAGKGSQEAKLKEMACDSGYKKNIKFVGWISREELPRYLRTADVYVSTSLSDSTSVSLLEAMSTGLVPVVTRVGENGNILTEGENGFLVAAGDYVRLAQKIIFVLKNNQDRMKLKKANREIIEEKYNFLKEMSKMECLYGKLTNKQ